MSHVSLRKNLVALYGVQVATLVLPLLTVPLLARNLGPSALGELAAVQSLFTTLGFLIEYGFNYSATRQVAIHRDDRSQLTRIFSEVLGAKLLLSVLFLLVSFVVYSFVSVFRTYPVLFWLGFLGALAQGFNLMWFYQGIEKLPKAASIDISLKFGYTVLVLMLVRSPADMTLVIGLQALSSLLSLVINTRHALPFVDRFQVTLTGSIAAIKEGQSMFFFRAVTVLYTSANTALLRLFVPAATVAQYSAAERLSSVSSSALTPVTQVIFPRLSHLVHHDFDVARKFFRKSLLATTAAATAALLLGFLSAPFVVEILFGEQFMEAIPLFRILLLNLPLVAISNLFGLQWMIPNGMERNFNNIIILAAILNLTSIMVFVPRFGPLGMAWGVVCCELLVTLLMVKSVISHPKTPFKRHASPEYKF